MEFYGAGETIECDASDIRAKKIVASPPLNHEVFGKCVKYLCTRDGIAMITKELNPRESKVNNPLSHMNLWDSLKANSFYVLVKGFKALKLEKVHFSGQHNANKFSTKDYTFAQISIPYTSAAINSIENNEYINPIKQLTKRRIP